MKKKKHGPKYPNSNRLYDANYKRWRAGVMKLNNGRCVWPNCKKKATQAHHIQPWRANPALRYSILNGCPLCFSHHKSIAGKEEFYIKMFIGIMHEKLRPK